MIMNPRKKPLNQCWSLGHMMALIEECKELDKKEKEKCSIVKHVVEKSKQDTME